MVKQLTALLVLLLEASLLHGQASNELLISEIFADPTPSKGLPEKEYIELYNNTAETISLEGFQLFYASNNVTFPSFELKPNAYLIICRKNNASFFKEFGDVLGLEKFSLLNSGTTLKIVNQTSELIFEITYSYDWYTPDKEQGFSLEMIDLGFPCRTKENWESSIAAIGGTPGFINASSRSKPDIEAPLFRYYEKRDKGILAFVFSEKLSRDSSILQFRSSLNISNILFDHLSTNTLLVELADSLAENEIYEIDFLSISDCSGNSSDLINVSIGDVAKPEKGDILLSEILFNPVPGGFDFVEFVNLSGKRLSLKGLKIGNVNSSGEVKKWVEIFDVKQTIGAKGIFCISENIKSQFGIYPKTVESSMIEIQNLPSFGNEAGGLVLLDDSMQVLEEVYYNKDMHHASIDDPEGVSLERIFLDKNNAIIGNWQSASSNDNFATPGYLVDYGTEKKFFVDINPDLITPDEDGFDEFAEISFRMNGSGNLSSRIYSSKGSLVKVLLNNSYVSFTTTVEWDGRDDSNQILPVEYYIVYSEFNDGRQVFQNKSKILLGNR